MLKKYRKQLFIALIIVFLCFFLLFLISSIVLKQNNKTSSIKVSFQTSNKIKIKNILAVSDQLGKEFSGSGTEEGVQGFVEFSLKNTSNKKRNYEIYLTENNDVDKELKISGNYIRFYLTNKVDAPYRGFEKKTLPTFNNMSVLVDKPEGKLLYRGTILPNKNEEFRLRAWLSDSYSLLGITKDKEFSVDVHVRNI